VDGARKPGFAESMEIDGNVFPGFPQKAMSHADIIYLLCFHRDFIRSHQSGNNLPPLSFYLLLFPLPPPYTPAFTPPHFPTQTDGGNRLSFTIARENMIIQDSINFIQSNENRSCSSKYIKFDVRARKEAEKRSPSSQTQGPIG
jgi:hypothetical protein